jgi:serine/threonine-protein kinase HipA
MKNLLKVMLWDKEIGRLAWDSHRHLSYFTYNPSILNGELDISPLVASVKDKSSRMPIYGETNRIYQKLPPFIADSLPDDWGNMLFESWRTKNKIATAEITPLEKLSFIGKRGMGALEYEPDEKRNYRDEKIDIKSLVNLAQKIYLQREKIRILPTESLTLQSLIAVGTSAGGRQPKAIIAINKKTKEVRSGQVAGLDGFDYCILKFGDAARSSAELEMTYYEMARKARINMMTSSLLCIDGVNHFLTKRFDRNGDKKLHTQTLAALYPEADSYEKLLWVCRKMRLSEKDAEEIFRRMIFNIIANNTDDHNKNFSFIMDQSGHWRLAPAYDMTFIFNNGGFLPQEEHCLLMRGKLNNITKEDALNFAADNGIRKPESIIHEVITAIQAFQSIAQKNGVKKEWIGRVEDCLSKHLANWGVSKKKKERSYINSLGIKISEPRIEQAYKGNYHLLATIDGHPHKYIIRAGTRDYSMINKSGITHISQTTIRKLIKKYFKN